MRGKTMKNSVKAYVDGWEKEKRRQEVKKQLAKTLGTRTDKIKVLSVITDDNGANLVKFLWMRNCDTYLAVISPLGNIQLYREV